MKLIYLNRWSIVFHAFHTTITEDGDRVLAIVLARLLKRLGGVIEG